MIELVKLKKLHFKLSTQRIKNKKIEERRIKEVEVTYSITKAMHYPRFQVEREKEKSQKDH